MDSSSISNNSNSSSNRSSNSSSNMTSISQTEEYKALWSKVNLPAKKNNEAIEEKLCMDDQVPNHPLAPLLLLDSCKSPKQAIESILRFMMYSDLRGGVEKRAVALLKNCLESKHLPWVCMHHYECFGECIFGFMDKLIMNIEEEENWILGVT